MTVMKGGNFNEINEKPNNEMRKKMRNEQFPFSLGSLKKILH